MAGRAEVKRTVVYCAYLESGDSKALEPGVAGSSVEIMSSGRVRLLWSEVGWPLQPGMLQTHAVEFHHVVQHAFDHRAVIPFRLLSVFDDRAALSGFLERQTQVLESDLERLQGFVQMEAVIYFKPDRVRLEAGGARYLRDKAELLADAERYCGAVISVLKGLARDMRLRQVRTGCRIFALVERGQEERFRTLVTELAPPPRLSRRVSGPWPASEFLSEELKSPSAGSWK